MDTLTNFRLADFSLAVPQGRHESSGHVCLTHGTQYTLRLGNHTDRRCDAQVMIDGQVVGCWRIQAGGTIELERPAHDTGRFTFYRLGTPEALAAQLVTGDELGLIAVTFMPESREQRECVRFSPCRGGTGLSGESAQRFTSVSPLDYDKEAFVMIYARLFDDVQAARPLGKPGWAAVPEPIGKTEATLQHHGKVDFPPDAHFGGSRPTGTYVLDPVTRAWYIDRKQAKASTIGRASQSSRSPGHISNLSVQANGIPRGAKQKATTTPGNREVGQKPTPASWTWAEKTVFISFGVAVLLGLWAYSKSQRPPPIRYESESSVPSQVARTATAPGAEELKAPSPYVPETNPLADTKGRSTPDKQASSREKIAPNGSPWPTFATYLSGMQKLAQGGYSRIKVDNTQGGANVYVKLCQSRDGPCKGLRHVYIPTGDEFTLADIAPGTYEIRYKNLATDEMAKSEPINLVQNSDGFGTHFSNVTLTLYRVAGGNTTFESLQEKQF